HDPADLPRLHWYRARAAPVLYPRRALAGRPGQDRAVPAHRRRAAPRRQHPPDRPADRRPDDTANFSTGEAVAVITRITNGNFRLSGRLIAQTQPVLDINHLLVVTREVVETARESLVIGVM